MTKTYQQGQPDVASTQSSTAPEAGEADHARAADATQDRERESAVNQAVDQYVVRVQCSRATLFAFVLDVESRFISFDEKPRKVTHDDALDIQQRLPAGSGTPTVSIEQVGTREM